MGLPKHIIEKNTFFRKKGVELWAFDGTVSQVHRIWIIKSNPFSSRQNVKEKFLQKHYLSLASLAGTMVLYSVSIMAATIWKERINKDLVICHMWMLCYLQVISTPSVGSRYCGSLTCTVRERQAGGFVLCSQVFWICDVFILIQIRWSIQKITDPDPIFFFSTVPSFQDVNKI
jgi:hypothetical protein